MTEVPKEVPAAKTLGLRPHNNHVPLRSSPLVRTIVPSEPSTPSEASRTSLPRTPSSRSDQHILPASAPKGGLQVPRLAHKVSTTSSASVYSTQSGEERQTVVPPSLIMAAFTPPSASRPLVDRRSVSRAPSAYHGTVTEEEQNRLSHISAGSAHLQEGSDDSDSSPGAIGYAN